MQSEQINELATALAKAQGQFKTAEEDKKNPHFKNTYSSINAIQNACREELSKNGLSVLQLLEQEADSLFIVTTLIHASGQWIKSKMRVSSKEMPPQALGSAITYMKRYALSAFLGIASGDDDDGNQAQEAAKNIVPQKNIPWVKPNGFDEFCEKHLLLASSTTTEPYKQDFLIESHEKNKIPMTEIICAMMKNEDRFEETFSAWMNKKYPNEKRDK
jgi:threonine dehydrogenase-like Zn-dependent dehydrogenase